MASIKIEDAAIKSYLGALPDHVFGAAKDAIQKAVANTHNKVVNNSKLKRRSGALMRSIRTDVRGSTLSALSGSVFSSKVPYSAIQETGGRVVAKRAYRGVQGGPYLNIPLSSNKTAAGVMRKTAKQVFREGGFMIKSRKGKHLVMGANGVPMFVLVKQVDIPARLGMRKAAENEVPLLMNRLRSLMQDAIQ